MVKNSIVYFDKKLCEDVSLSSMMIVSELQNGVVRFDCSICRNRYKHHPSLFRHFKSAHKAQYEQKVALRERIKAEREIHKMMGLPYMRRRNQKRKTKGRKKNKENVSPLPEKPNPHDSRPQSSDLGIVTSEEKYIIPVSNVQSAPVYYSCSNCNQQFPSQQHLDQHGCECQVGANLSVILNPILDAMIKNEKELYVCGICGTDLENIDNFSTHMRINHEEYWTEVQGVESSPETIVYGSMNEVNLNQISNICENYICEACREIVDKRQIHEHQCYVIEEEVQSYNNY